MRSIASMLVFSQSVGVSLTELFNLVSNIWYLEIVV